MEYSQGDHRPPERDFSYGELVRSAFRISWRNKFLWFFGFFVGSGLSSSFNVPSNFGGAPQNQDVPNFDQLFSTLSQTSSQLDTSTPLTLQAGLDGGSIALIIGAVVLALVLVVVLIALVFISQGGLASSVAAIDGGEERRFGETWRAGLSNVLRLILQAILFFLISIAVFILVALVAGLPILLTFLLSESVGLRVAMSIIFGLIGVLLFVAIVIPLTVISQFAVRELVVGRSGAASSIGGAYRLFRRNIGRSLLVWLLNIGLKIVAGIGTFLVLALLALILIGPGVAVGFSGATTTGIALGIIGGVLFLIPAAILTGAVGTYFHAYWTLAYLRLNGIGGAAVPAYPYPNQPPESGYASPYPADDSQRSATTTVERQTDEARSSDDTGENRESGEDERRETT